jgi:hypothetical protein
MIMAAAQSDRIVSAATPQAYRYVRSVLLSLLTIAVLASFDLENVARAAEQSKADAAVADRVQSLIPELEAYVISAVKGFDVRGLAIGIVAGDKLVSPRVSGCEGRAVACRSIRARSSRSARLPGVSRRDKGHNGRPRKAAVGRPRC